MGKAYIMELKVLENIDINLPSCVIDLIRRLNNRGIDSYIVGGAVRNFLLGHDFIDIDIFCKCDKEHLVSKTIDFIEIDYEFDNVLLTTIYDNDWSFFQQSISCNETFKEDFHTRDYTINSFWYDPLRKELLGFDKSFNDLNQNKLKLCKNDSNDGLKYLRGIRLSTLYGLINMNEFNYNRKFKDIDTKFKALRLRNEISKHSTKSLMERRLLGTLIDKLKEFDIHV